MIVRDDFETVKKANFVVACFLLQKSVGLVLIHITGGADVDGIINQAG